MRLKIGFVGTGYIANVHAEVLNNLSRNSKFKGNLFLSAVCDTNSYRLHSFAKKNKIRQSFNDLSTFIKNTDLNFVHVLTPPNTHYKITKELLKNKINVFVEKPFCLKSDEAKELMDISLANNLYLGINHNVLFHPLFLRLKKNLHNLGPINRVVIYQSLPLGQLIAGKFYHWMFRSPENIIFEQAPHPISLLRDLLGELVNIKGAAYNKRELTLGQYFYDCWQAIVECENGIGFIHLSFAENVYPQSWVCVSSQDGSIFIDLYKNLYLLQKKSVFPDYLDPTSNAIKYSSCTLQGIKNFLAYVLSKFKIISRTDSFFVSMKNSIESFYGSFLSKKGNYVSAEDGFKVIQFCEKWIESAKPIKNPSIVFSTKKKLNPEILIIGANGFIGSYLVNNFVNNDIPVRVLVRNHYGLKPILYSELVERVVGDILDEDSIISSFNGIKYVYHLAHGGGDSWQDFYNINVLATQKLAEISLQNKIKYFVYLSTIAVYSYIKFPKGSWITEEDPIDSRPDKRNFYARSKILAENVLLELFRKKDLPLIIFRPGIVLGKGTSVYHGGIGDWLRDNVCLYWGWGINPLPYVLVDDVAKVLTNILSIDNLHGEIFNLCGDVCFSARKYISYLRRFSGRDIKGFPFPITLLYFSDILKYIIKISTGQGKDAILSYRDLYNRSIPVRFDCQKAKKKLSWKPCNNLDEFLDKAIAWAFKVK